MAGQNGQNVFIGINISKKYVKQLQEFANSIEATTTKVKELQKAVFQIGESFGGGNQKFSASTLVSALSEVKTAIAAIKDAKFENVTKAMEALNSTQLTNFANAVGLLKGNLDSSLVQQITSFGNAIQAMGTAQGKFNGAMLVQDIKDLMSGLGKLNISANQTQNITNLKDALSGLSIPLNQNTIAALSQLGYALRNIREYAEGKNVLMGLSTGIKQFSKLQEVDGLLHNVRKLASAADILNRSEKLDFSKFVDGLKQVEQLNKDMGQEHWANIKSVATGIQKAFAPIDGMKLPNLSSLATAVQTLTAMEKDAQGNVLGVKHDMTLFGQQLDAAAAHIQRAFTPLQNLKMPQIGGIAKNLDILSTATYNFRNIEAIVRRFKQTLGTLHGIQMPNLNNFAKGLNELQKLKTGVPVRMGFGEELASLKKDLVGWENIKVPNLASFAKGLKDLASGKLDTRQISENLSAIPNKLRWLTGIQVPDLSGFAKGIHELSKPTVSATRAATAIGTAIDTIHTSLAGKGEIKFPSLATFAKGIKEFHFLAETGKTDEENLKKIVTPIKTLITELQGVGKVDLPNLNGIAVAIHKLSTAVPADAGTTVANHITAITAAVKGLDKIQVPDLTKISKAFETLNKSYVNYYTSGVTGKHGSSFEHIAEDIKKSLDSLKGIQVPNLSGIASAFKTLNSNLLKEEIFSIGKWGLQSQSSRYIDRNIEAIKETVTKLGEVGNIRMPNLSSITNAFKTLNKEMVSGGITDDYGNRVGDNLSRNIHAIKTAVTELGTVGDVRMPPLASIVAAFKTLNESVLRGFSDPQTKTTVTNLEQNINALKTALSGMGEVKIPSSLSSLAAAFKTFNEAVLRGFSDIQTKTTTTNIQQNLSALKTALDGFDKISVPNLKQLADGLKNIGGMDLPTRGIFGMGGTKLENNIKVLKSALSMLDGYKIPNIAQLAKGITEIANFDIPTSKSFLGIKWGDKLKENIGSFNTAIKDIKGTTVPNAAQLAEGIKILSGDGINGATAARHIKDVTEAIVGLNKVSVPNLKPFADGLLTLNEIPRRALKETHLKGIFDTVRRAVGEFGEVRLPALDSLAKGVKNLSSESANADVAAKKITALAKAIHGEEGSPGLANVTVPNLSSIANAVSALSKEVKKAEEAIPTNKGLLSKVAATIRKEEKEIEQAAQDKSAAGALQANLKALQDGLQGFNDLRVPSVAHIANAFKILNESTLLGQTSWQKGAKSGEFTSNISRNLTALKTEIEKLKSLENINIPNLSGIATAFKTLNEGFVRYTFDLGSNKFNSNIGHTVEAIKQAVTSLGEVGKVKLPTSFSSIASAFRSLDEAIPKGKTAFDTHRFDGNIDKIIKGIGRFSEVKGIDIPNISHIAKAFRELDSAVPSNLRGRTGESYIDKNIASVVKAVRDLGAVGDVKLPKIKNIGDAFKTLNESVNKVGMFDGRGNWTGYATRVQAAVKALHEAITSVNWDGIKLPNVKNIADAFKTLNGEVLERVNIQGEGRVTRVKQNLRALKDALESVDLGSIKVPNVKNVSDAFKTLNSIENLETFKDKDGKEINSRVKHYVNEIASAIRDAGTTLKDIKIPNIKNVADAFKTLNSIEVKEDKASNFVQNLNKVWEQLRKYKEDETLKDIKFPNLKNIADAFRTLDTVLKPSDKINTGKFDENFKAVKGAIEQLKDFDKLKLPNLKNIADAFKILNESVLVGWNTPGKGATTRVQQNIDEVVQALNKLKDTEITKLPNLKNIADAFNILGTIPKGMAQDNRIDVFKTNIEAIINVLHESKEKLSKIQLPNLKNIADAFNILNESTLKNSGTIKWGEGRLLTNLENNIAAIKNALTQLHDVSKDAQGKQFKLPNLEGIAKGFKTLNELTLQNSNTIKWSEGRLATNLENNIRAITSVLKEFEGKNFDLPNINNLATGLQKLNNISKINQDLAQNMQTLKDGLEVLRGVQVPKQFKNFADGLHSLEEFSKKSTGTLISAELSKDLSDLAAALSRFTGITLPPNLQGFAKGIEAIAKVNVTDFTKNFGALMNTMKTLNLDTTTTALDHLTAKLAVCSAGIHAIENKLRQASSSFAGFGNSTRPAEDGLSRLQERIKMFLQYRVISTVFNRITTWLQAIPQNIKEFEKAMYNVQSITGATDVTVAKLGVTVKEIASTTKFSAQEVADGMTMIAQAGFTAGQSMQMMQSISNLATGTLSDMKTVVDLVTSAMVVFNIESNDAARVSDVFANAVNKSKLTMEKIKTAFNYIGPVARDANVTFEESAVAMMLLANSGQKASTIGTGLRNVFSTLLSPSKKLTEAAAAVGVSLTDLDPRVNSFKDVISNLGIVVRDSQVALDVFGKRGSTAVLSLTNGAKDFDRLYSAVTRVGSAAEMASKQQEGLFVRWKNLSDRAQLLAVTIGQNGLTWVISGFVDAVSGLINLLNKLNESPAGRVFLRINLTIAALTSLTAIIVSVKAIWAPFVMSLTRGMVSIIGLFPKITAGGKAAAAGIAAMTAAGQAGTAATITFGTALRALLSIAWPIGLAVAAISVAMGSFTVALEGVELHLQKVSQNLDRINNQSQSVGDALEKITKLQPKTEEYANTIKAVMTAINDNKGPVVGAETEFRALQAAINETNDAFTDGGVALRQYGQRLKELAVTQSTMALQDSAKLFESSMRTTGFHLFGRKYGGKLTTQAKERYGLLDNADYTGAYNIRDMDYSTARRIFNDIASGKVGREDIFKDKEDYSDALNTFNTLNEQAETFINKMADAGKISFHTSITQVTDLARRLGITGTQLDAVKEIYMELNKVAKERLFAGIEPSDVKDSVQSTLRREIEGRKVNVSGVADFNIDSILSMEEKSLADTVRKQVESVKVNTEELKKHMEGTAVSLREVAANTKGIDVNIEDEDITKATKVYADIIRIHKSIEDARKQYADKLEKAESEQNPEARRLAVEKVNKEYAALVKTLTALNDEYLKERNSSENVAALTRGLRAAQELALKIEEINKNTDATILKNSEGLVKKIREAREQFNAEGFAVLDGYRYDTKGDLEQAIQDTVAKYREANERLKVQSQEMIETATQSAKEALKATLHTAVPVETRLKEMLKEEKEKQKIRDINTQKEMNRIHIIEDAYKQSEGRIGIDFKQARAAEQEVLAKAAAARIAALKKIEEELTTVYKGTEGLDKALETLKQQMEKATEDAYKSQYDLEQKFLKASMMQAKMAGEAIEKEAKRANKVREQEQEKTLHAIALMESKGVITHEQAEKQRTEASIKHHREMIDARKAQISELTQVGAADNIAQIKKLEEEIEKGIADITKTARKGIEEQTKAIHENQKKLRELQGSDSLKPVSGDFAMEQQRKITEEYKQELETRKKYDKEGLDYVAETEFSSMSKVAEAVRKHYDRVDSIRTKSAEKQDALEKDMLKKAEDHEKRRLDIINKYNKKEIEIEKDRQDALDIIEANGDSNKLNKKKLGRAEERIRDAGSQIETAIQAGDKDSLAAISNQLKSDASTLLGSDRPRKYKNDIMAAYNRMKEIAAAQRNIELAEEDEKYQRELKRDKERLAVLKETAEGALLAENGRHELAMEHLEKEAQKLREMIELEKERVSILQNALNSSEIQEGTQEKVPQKIERREDGTYANVPPVGQEQQRAVQAAAQPATQSRVGHDNGALPTNMKGTWQHAVNQIIGATGISDKGAVSVLQTVLNAFKPIKEAAEQTTTAVQETANKATTTVADATQKAAESATASLGTMKQKAEEAKKAVEEETEITREKAEEHLSDFNKTRINASDPDKMAEAAKKAGLQVTAEGVATNLYNPEEAKKSAEEVAKIDADFRERVKQAADKMNEDNKKAAEGFEQDFKIAVDSVSNLIGLLEGRVQDVQQYVKDNPIVFVSNAEESQARIDDVFELITQYINDKFDSINVPIGIDEDSAKKGIEFLREDVTYLVRDAYKLVVEGKVDDAIRKLQGIKAELDKLKDKTITVTVEKVEKDSTGGSVGTYATGGQVYRKLQSRFINTGSGNKDDVPALLMKNEFVHRAAAVKKYGVDFMYKLNNLQIPKSITQMFANGGLVSNAFGAVHKFANGGLIRSTRRKLEELFAGSGVNLNVDNLNITGKMEEAANQFTSPIGMQAMSMLAKNIESGISRFVIGGPITGAALSASQIQNISAAYSTSIAKAQASGNAAIAQALTEERKRLYDLSDELQQVLASLNAEYNTEARKLNEEHRQKLKEKKEEYEKNVEEENTTYAEKVEEDKKTQKKEDEDYAESKAERDENYHTSLQEMKDNLEKERLDYEANLLSKQQALIERQNAITQLRNQLTSDKYPAGTSQHASASIEELMQAHAAYAQQLYGSDRMYILDLGGTIQRTEENDDVKKARLQQLKDAVRPLSAAQTRTINQVLTKAMNTRDPHFRGAYQNYLNIKDSYNESRGYNAYKRALAEYSGEGEKKPVKQNLPYSTYLMQHLRSDYTLPLQQAELELASAMKEDNPDTKFAKDSAKLTKDYLKATKEAEESRTETLEAREKNNADRDKSHKEKLTELKKDYDTFVEEENKSYREALAKLKEDTEQKIEDAKEGKYELEEDTKDNTEKVIEHAKTNMRRSVAAARRDKENWLAAVQSSHRQEADKAAENKQEDIYIPRTSSATSSNQSGFMSNLMSFAGGLDIEELLKKFKNGMLKFAKGGLVPFLPGSKPNVDSVLSLLSPNEFVMSAKAVRTFGTSFMNSLNNLKIPAFATGGMVGASTPVAESAIEKIVNKTVYALDLTLNNTHIGELMGEKDTIDSFMNVMNRARMGMV